MTVVNPEDQTVSCIECPRADVAYLMINHGRYWLCPDCDSSRLRDEEEG